MTIGWVESLLLRWGRWSVKASNGYPPFSPMFKQCESGTAGRYQYDPGFQSIELYACDRAIQELPESTRQTMVLIYAFGHSIRAVAAASDCSRTRIRAVIDGAHSHIAKNLDIAEKDHYNAKQHRVAVGA